MIKKTNKEYSLRLNKILDKKNCLSFKIDNINIKTINQLNIILSSTLLHYKLDMWSNYISLLLRALLYFTFNSCSEKNCIFRIIKSEKAISIQIYADNINQNIKKRDFISFINDLSDNKSISDSYSDLYFLKYLFESKTINPDNINYSSKKIELNLPDNKLSRKEWSKIGKSIISSIESLPPIKENLVKLEEMLHKGSFDMESIANQVAVDSALSADILKIINSGAYHLNRKIGDIFTALKYLGLRELYNLMLSLSVKNLLSIYNKNMRSCWLHSYKCAFYSSYIVNDLSIPISKSESTYTAALLHDIGKFPLFMIFDDYNQQILKYCTRYNISQEEIENAVSGLSHCETGAQMAKQWNLPETLQLIIKYHHNPIDAPENIRTLNDIIYMADCLISSEEKQFNIESIEKKVLNRNRIKNYQDFVNRFSYLKFEFENNNLFEFY